MNWKNIAILIVLIAATVDQTCAESRCTAEDPAIKKCVTQALMADNVVIAGHISDPGGTKTKSATDLCQLECNTKAAEFDQKYRK